MVAAIANQFSPTFFFIYGSVSLLAAACNLCWWRCCGKVPTAKELVCNNIWREMFASASSAGGGIALCLSNTRPAPSFASTRRSGWVSEVLVSGDKLCRLDADFVLIFKCSNIQEAKRSCSRQLCLSWTLRTPCFSHQLALVKSGGILLKVE
jgi:hypothetical protein